MKLPGSHGLAAVTQFKGPLGLCDPTSDRWYARHPWDLVGGEWLSIAGGGWGYVTIMQKALEEYRPAPTLTRHVADADPRHVELLDDLDRLRTPGPWVIETQADLLEELIPYIGDPYECLLLELGLGMFVSTEHLVAALDVVPLESPGDITACFDPEGVGRVVIRCDDAWEIGLAGCTPTDNEGGQDVHRFPGTIPLTELKAAARAWKEDQ